MATLPYQPIQTPPGGLLASAVGTPQNPQPPLPPESMQPPLLTAPTSLAMAPRAYENDSVANQLNALTDSGSSYIKQAEAAGERTAQRRGLLNSSIAAGAARGAAITAAAPIAMQDAQQMAQRNLARLDADYQTDRLNAGIVSQEKMQGLDLASRTTLQEADIANQRSLQANEISSRNALQTQALQAESDRLGRTLTAQEAQSVREITNQQFMQTQDITSRTGMLNTELANRTQLQREDAAAQLARLGLTTQAENLRANLSAAAQIQVQTLQNLNQQQQTSLSYYASMTGNYLQASSSVWNNPNIPAPARQQAIDQFAAVLNSGVNMPAAIYGANMSWGGATVPASTGTQTIPTGTAPAPAPVPTFPTITPTPITQGAYPNTLPDGSPLPITSYANYKGAGFAGQYS